MRKPNINDVLETLKLIVLYEKEEDPPLTYELSNYLSWLSELVEEGEQWDPAVYESFRQVYLTWASQKKHEDDYRDWKRELEQGRKKWKDKEKHWWWYVL